MSYFLIALPTALIFAIYFSISVHRSTSVNTIFHVKYGFRNRASKSATRWWYWGQLLCAASSVIYSCSILSLEIARSTHQPTIYWPTWYRPTHWPFSSARLCSFAAIFFKTSSWDQSDVKWTVRYKVHSHPIIVQSFVYSVFDFTVTILLTAVLSLCVVSYDRLTAIVLPMEKRITMRGAKMAMLFTWVIGSSISIPFAVCRFYKVTSFCYSRSFCSQA